MTQPITGKNWPEDRMGGGSGFDGRLDEHPALRRMLQLALPMAALAALLVWAWRNLSLAHSIPAYGDTLEMMWVLTWYSNAVRAGQSIAVYPLAFFPAGWHYTENLYMLLALLPLAWLKGPAFAFNSAVLLTFVVGFCGAYNLARRFVDRGVATVVALLAVFWGGRWFHQMGHLNILIGSAMAPWVLYALDRALSGPTRWKTWLVATGLLWALAMTGSLYFALIIGMSVAAWILGYFANRAISWRKAAVAFAIPTGITLLVSAPAIYWLQTGSAQTGAVFYSIGEVNFWGASLNNLPIPSLDHPWLGSWARSIYRGIPYEQGLTNFGLLASVLALMGGWAAWKRRRPDLQSPDPLDPGASEQPVSSASGSVAARSPGQSAAWLSVLFLAVFGVMLTLGLTLKWDNESVRWSLLRPVDAALWWLGHALKPEFFTGSQPPPPFDTAVPLPGMLLVAVVPWLERARVFARYALAGGLGIFLLAGLGLTLVKNRWARLGLAALLVFEVVPAPLPRLPYPPLAHPAFTWLESQELQGGSIADIIAAHPFTPGLLNEGDTVLETLYHGKPTVNGASSIWPAHTLFLYDWLASHQHAFWNLDLVPILRFYGIRYILIHMRSDSEDGLVQEAKQNQELKYLQCFPPAEGASPYKYPICVLEVLPAANPNVNLVLGDGWSGAEAWGAWAEGTVSEALWVATEQTDHRLAVEAFPICLDAPGRTTSVEVNGVTLATHTWTGCDSWSEEITVPASLVRLGGNSLVIRSSHAARPADLPGDTTADTRLLSAGFSKLRIEPGP